MNETGDVRREYSERQTFASLRLGMVDLQQLVALMCAAIPGGQCDVRITVEEGRTESTYSTLAALQSDTTLPDVVKKLTISVTSPWSARNTNEYLQLRFFTLFGANIAVTGHDETLVVGAKHRLSEFLRRCQKTRVPATSWFVGANVTAGLGYIVTSVVVGLIIGWVLLHRGWIAAVMLLLAYNVFGVYLLWRAIRIPEFSLIVRNQSQGIVNRYITTPNVLLVLTVLLLIVAVLTWLYPRTPAEPPAAVTSSKPAAHGH